MLVKMWSNKDCHCWWDCNRIQPLWQTIQQFLSELNISHHAAAAAAKSLQLYPTLCDPIDGSPPGTSAHGIFQARVLEWVAIAFSEAFGVDLTFRFT